MLTLLSMLCRSLFWFPVWQLLLSLRNPALLLPAAGILLGSSLLSSCGTRYLRLKLYPRKRLAAQISFLIMSACAVLCAVCCALLKIQPAVCILLTVCTFLGTHRKNDAPPESLFTVNSYAVFLSVSVIVSFMLSAAHLPANMSLTLAVVGTVSALFFLQRNQYMLRRYINRRTNIETDVPQEIRRGNLMLVGGIILLLAFVFLFREPLLHLLTQIRKCMIEIVSGILHLLHRVILFFSGNDVPLPEETEEIVEEAEAFPVPEKTNPLWNLLWIPFFAVAWIIWREFLSDWVYDIRIAVQDLIARLRHADPEKTAVRRTETDEYYDNEMTVARETRSRHRQRAWRRALRQWQAMPESSEKFYAGYRLLLDAPCWQAELLHPSDTVLEIREKWAAYYTPQEALDAVTDDFHADRYAENGLPPEAIADLTKALQCIRHTT
ncbi:MAG: hypothetical protein IJM46_11610 [Oscillospiraceae bacterium]|nr:hypothetical protein [Oscillospiraceae bacterium]